MMEVKVLHRYIHVLKRIMFKNLLKHQLAKKIVLCIEASSDSVDSIFQIMIPRGRVRPQWKG